MKNYFKILFAALLCVALFTSCETTENQRIKIEPTEIQKVETAPIQDTIYESVQTYEHTAQNENHTNRNIGFGLMFIAMAAGSVPIRTNFFQSIWVNFIFDAAEKIAKQFLDKLNYNWFVLFKVCKEILLALVDKDKDNMKQIQAILNKYADEIIDFLLIFLADRLKAKLANNANLSEANKQLALAQPEMMRITYENAEHSDFSSDLAFAILEKKSQYPNLANLVNPTV